MPLPNSDDIDNWTQEQVDKHVDEFIDSNGRLLNRPTSPTLDMSPEFLAEYARIIAIDDLDRKDDERNAAAGRSSKDGQGTAGVGPGKQR